MMDVFGPDGHVMWWQECLRALVIIAYGLLAIRLAGRRTFGNWSAIDTVVSILIGSTLSRVVTGNAPVGGTLAATTLIIFIHWVLAQFVARSAAASQILEGRPMEVVRNGQVDHKVRLKQAISDSDIAEALRQKQFQDISQVGSIMLEPGGALNAVKR